MTVLLILAVITATATAVRSTWSPCGVSMLSTITPLAETGRGHRFSVTASWFVAGAVLGGVSLGLLAAAGALVAGALGLGVTVALVVAAVAATVTATSDLRIGGRQLPFHPRQVNEVWLDQYRPWVYGAGFGWQIGCGLATYIMTAAVYLTILLAALTASPAAAIALGVWFGLVRGLAVLLGARITTPTQLIAFHRRFDGLAEPTRRAMIAVQAVVALAAITAAGGFVGLGLGLALAVLIGGVVRATTGSATTGPATTPAPAAVVTPSAIATP